VNTTTPLVSPSPQAVPARGLFTRIWRALAFFQEPSIEEGLRRMGRRPGPLDSLSPEALERLRTYDGPENSGPPLTKRERRDLEERLARQQ
jgi:hypothetical protein